MNKGDRRRWPIATPANARNEQQRAQLEEAIRTGQCSFCPGGDAFGKAELLAGFYDTMSLHVIRNSWPHPGASECNGQAQHYVIFPRACVSDKEDLQPHEWQHVNEVVKRLMADNKLPHLFFYTRSGNPAEAATTITHWHCQVFNLKRGGEQEVFLGAFQPLADENIRVRAVDSGWSNRVLNDLPEVASTRFWRAVWHPQPLAATRHRQGRRTDWLIYPRYEQRDDNAIQCWAWRELLEIQQKLKRKFRLTASFLVGSVFDWTFETFSIRAGTAVKFKFVE